MPSRKQLRQAQDTTESVEHVTIGEGDAALHVSYRSGMVSPRVIRALEAGRQNAMGAVDALVEFIESTVVAWDLQDEDDGPPIPLTYDDISRVEVPLLRLVVEGLIADNTPGEANGTPSSPLMSTPLSVEGS